MKQLNETKMAFVDHGFTLWGAAVVLIGWAGYWIRQLVRWIFGVNESLDDIKTRLDKMEPEVSRHGERLGSLDVQHAQVQAKLDAIMDMMRDVLRRLDRRQE
jgi:hypothetical protein